MNSTDCLDSKQLIEYTDGNLTENENQKIINHLEKCEQCTRNLKILTQMDEILNMEGEKFKDDTYDFEKNSNCISDDLLYRYLEGRISESEAEAIEKHLNSCPVCFNDMASVVRNSLTPATESEEAEIARMRIITPEQQVAKILEYCKPFLKEPARRKQVKFTVIIKNRIKQFIEKWIYTRYVWRPGIAVSVLIIFICGILLGVRYFNTGYQISEAEKLLLKNQRIFIENARLSGGYSSTGMSVILAPENEKFTYLDQAESKLNRAVSKGAKALKAKRLLAHIFLFKNQNARADSVFVQIEREPETSAASLNDLGVLYFQKQQWGKAVDYFQSAIEINENFPEPYYNLALTKKEMEKLDEALAIFNKYVEIEDDEVWRDAAKRLISEINKTMKELK